MGVVRLFSRLTLVACVSISMSPARAEAASGPPPPEPARLRASTALIDEALGQLLPLDVVLPGPMGSAPDAGNEGPSQAALITELRYCGATDKGTGRFRAVVRWGTSGAAPTVLGGADACRQTLGDLAKRADAPASDSGLAVADLEASWRPWELKLSLVRALTPSSPSPPRPGPPRPLATDARPLLAIEIRRDLLTLATAGLRIPTESGEFVTVHAAPSFLADGIEVAAIVGDNGSSPPASRPAAGGLVPASSDANVVLDLPYSTANQILRQLSERHTIAVPVEREVIELQNLSLVPGPGAGGATLNGTATPRSLRETVRLAVLVAGADLKVISLRADAQLENCADLGPLAAIACNTRNAARNTAAAVATSVCQKYQGSLVRDLAGAQVLSVDFDTRRLELRGVLTRTAAGSRGLMVWGRVSPGSSH